MSGAELELINQPQREALLKHKIDQVSDYYHIIIDTPPSLGILTLNALVACKTLRIPVQTEHFALEGMSQLMKVVGIVKERLRNPMKSRYLLTMYDTRMNLSREVADQVRGHFKGEVLKTVIPRNVMLAESPSYGVPIAIYAPQSAGTIAYEQLAEEVIGW